MADPTITPYPLPPPKKNQGQVVFDTNINAYFDWLSRLNAPEMTILIPWMITIRDEIAATAMSGDLPNISGRATQYVRVNSGETGMEFRTQAQTLADIGAIARFAPLVSPVLTGFPQATRATSTDSSNRIATTSFVKDVAKVKAWVNFNGQGTSTPVRASFNISSVSDTSLGKYIINFANDISDADYSAVSNVAFSATNSIFAFLISIYNKTAGSCEVATFRSTSDGDATPSDAAVIDVAIIR